MKERYGIAEYMFGVSVKDDKDIDFLIRNNADEYVESFKEKYGDDCMWQSGMAEETR